jgi:hypothetical protein
MFRVAVDDASVHRARYIDLVGDQLHRYLRGAGGELGLDDVGAVKPKDSRLEGLLGGGPLVDRRGEFWELRRSAKATSRLVAAANARTPGAVRTPS